MAVPLARPVAGPAESATRNVQSLPAANTADHVDSEYEHEYDENEKEDFYFTLDLTTHVPDAVVPVKYGSNGKVVKKNTKKGKDAATLDHSGQADDANSGIGQPKAPSGSVLQFVGLDTLEPYVKFNNGFYSCDWFTDIGTQLWMSQPGVVQDPRMQGHVLDVIGSSQVRLVGKPVTVKLKQEAKRARDAAIAECEQADAAAQEEISDESADDYDKTAVYRITKNQRQPLQIPREAVIDTHAQGQASFLERLSALKHKRGEKNPNLLPLRMPHLYNGIPLEQQDILREHALKEDAARKAKLPRGTVAMHPGDAKGKYKSLRPAPPRPGTGMSGSVEDPGFGPFMASQPDPTGERQSRQSIIRDFAKRGLRAPDGPRGGAPTREAVRVGLGLGSSLPAGSTASPAPTWLKAKRGRPSNAVLAARREAEAQCISELMSTPAAFSAHSARRPSTANGTDATAGAQHVAQPLPAESVEDTVEDMDLDTTLGENISDTQSLREESQQTLISEHATPRPDGSAWVPAVPGIKIKRRRRTAQEMHEVKVHEAIARGETPPPPPQSRRVGINKPYGIAPEMSTPQEGLGPVPEQTPGTSATASPARQKKKRTRRTPAQMALARAQGLAPPPRKAPLYSQTRQESADDDDAGGETPPAAKKVRMSKDARRAMEAARDEEARKIFMTPGMMPVEEMVLDFGVTGPSAENGQTDPSL